MKRKELVSLGINEEQAGKIMALHGADIERHKAEATGLKSQLAEASKQIEGFKALDIEGVCSAAAQWEQRYQALGATHQKQQQARRAAEAAAQSYARGCTGLRAEWLDEHEDLSIAILVFCSDLYDNWQMAVDNDKENRVVQSILDCTRSICCRRWPDGRRKIKRTH